MQILYTTWKVDGTTPMYWFIMTGATFWELRHLVSLLCNCSNSKASGGTCWHCSVNSLQVLWLLSMFILTMKLLPQTWGIFAGCNQASKGKHSLMLTERQLFPKIHSERPESSPPRAWNGQKRDKKRGMKCAHDFSAYFRPASSCS